MYIASKELIWDYKSTSGVWMLKARIYYLKLKMALVHPYFRLDNNNVCSHESPGQSLAMNYSRVSLRGLVKTALRGSKETWGSLRESEKVLSLAFKGRGATDFDWNPAEGRCLGMCWLDFGWEFFKLS